MREALGSHAGSAAGVTVLTESGPEIGYGHVIRVRALLDEMQMPADVYGGGDAERFFRDRRYGRTEDLDAVLEVAQQTVLVVDRPDSRRWSSFVESPNVVVVAIDDAGGSAVRGDVVVNGSGFPGHHHYPSVPENAIVCAGFEYALLRREFRDLLAYEGPGRGVAIVAGSSSRVQVWVEQLIALGVPSEWEPVLFVVSPAFPERAIGEARGKGIDVRCGLSASDLIAAMRTRRLCVTTAGMTMVEAFSIGVPVAAYPAQPNMVDECRYYHERGWIVDLGSDAAVPERVVEAVSDVLGRQSLPEMGRAVRRHVDGRGAVRVAALIEDIAATFGRRDKAHTLATVAERHDVLQN
jgi:spore coat polysaccharide biosynthesis predicted glycosyltransferase SpsG